MKNLKLQERKTYLKSLAREIRELKSQRKSKPYGYVSGLYSSQWEYRCKHIAYCMARGRSYEEIEKSTHTPIEQYYWDRINEDIEELRGGFSEDVCDSE